MVTLMKSEDRNLAFVTKTSTHCLSHVPKILLMEKKEKAGKSTLLEHLLGGSIALPDSLLNIIRISLLNNFNLALCDSRALGYIASKTLHTAYMNLNYF